MSREIESPYRPACSAPASARPTATAPQLGDSLDAAALPARRSRPRRRAARRPPAPRGTRRRLPARRSARRRRRQARRGLGQGRAAHAPRDGARGLAEYDIDKDEICGEGQRHVAQRARLDHAVPRCKFQRDTRDRLLRRAALLHRRDQRARRGEGDPLRRAPTCTRRARRSTRPASRPTTTGTCAATRSRSTSCARSAPRTTRACTSSDVPVMYTPWLEFPLSNERKSGFLTPTIGSTQIRGFEVRGAVLLQPRAQLRRDGRRRGS